MRDEEIVEKFQSGDRSAFDELLQRYQTLVLNTCFRFLNHKEDAEDAAQEVFIKTYKALDRFQPNAKFSTWLYRITVNHCLNVQRSRKRKPFVSVDNPLRERTVEQATIASNQSYRPDNIREKGERAEMVQHAINALPKKQRTALILSRYEGLSYKEIAQVMGSSVASVESRLHCAKINLYQELRSYFED
jgi:RNA polymerase sigma-70 factor (ECF subfamily)